MAITILNHKQQIVKEKFMEYVIILKLSRKDILGLLSYLIKLKIWKSKHSRRQNQ